MRRENGKTMLNEDIVIAHGKKEFDEKVDKYFVNMLGNRRTLHITNSSNCPHSKCADSFIPFSTMEDVLKYEAIHKNATPFHRCGNCFKTR